MQCPNNYLMKYYKTLLLYENNNILKKPLQTNKMEGNNKLKNNKSTKSLLYSSLFRPNIQHKY